MNELAGAEHAGLRAYTPLRPTGGEGPVEPSGLREYAQLLWRKKVIVLVVAAVCVVGTLGYCVLVKPTYEGTASVLLEPAISQTLVEANNPTSVTAVPNVPDGIEVIESANVAALVDRSFPGAPAVTATQVGTTDVVQVSARSKDPRTAAAVANAYAKAYIHYEQQQTLDTFTSAQAQLQNKVNIVQLAISNLNTQIKAAPAGTNLTPDETQLGDLQDQFATLQDQLQNYQFYSSQGVTTEVGQVISSATVPTKPVSPKTLEWTVLALIFGVILGIGVALLVNALAPRPWDDPSRLDRTSP